MGMPSATIYPTELIRHDRVKRLVRVGPARTSDAFYHPDATLMVATISDHVVRGDSLPSEEREKTFAAMVSVALGALAR